MEKPNWNVKQANKQKRQGKPLNDLLECIKNGLLRLTKVLVKCLTRTFFPILLKYLKFSSFKPLSYLAVNRGDIMKSVFCDLLYDDQRSLVIRDIVTWINDVLRLGFPQEVTF